MKMRCGKFFALLLSLALLIPVLGYQSEAVAYAATPTFVDTTKEFTGDGETYQLEIENKVSGSTYKWSSSNTKVAKVSSKGLITTVGPGTAKIKCKITYPSSKTKTLTSKITVVIPATEVKINNSVEVNGAHILNLGESFDFNRDIVPTNSSYKTHWSIGGGDPDCIRIDDNTSGKITATKVGKVILKATATKTRNNVDIINSIVDDAIIIEVVGLSATVQSAEITDSTEIKVVFDSPVDPNTVIGQNNKLQDSIEISMRKNIKGVLASDPGALTATLSSDNRVLTIQTANMLEGEYGINFTSKIRTTVGTPIEEYYKQLSFTDNVSPFIKEITLDDTGMVANIYFNEAIDFSNLKVSNASLINTTGTNADPSTLTMLNNRVNYIASEDRKSLSINLSKIAYTDYGKTFSVTFTGIKDLSGNIPSSYTLTAFLHTDNSQKPQPRALSVVRSGYNVLTATFDRSVQFGGQAQVNNGSILFGVVDSKDSKKVNYTMYDAESILNGNQVVKLGYWMGFNPIQTDQSNNQMYSFSVNFTSDQMNPVLMNHEFDAKTNILTLNYNEEVELALNTGVFNSILRTVTDEIRSGTLLNYTKVDSTDKKIVKLLISNMTLTGNYTLTLDQGFVKDNFRNNSLARTITIGNAGSTALELPGPYLITQSSTNLSQISLEFAQMLDVASATNLANYQIPGLTIISAEIRNNTKDNGATVVLTVLDGSIDVTVERPITIRGVKGYNGSYAEIEEFTKMVELKDNKRPLFLGSPEYDRSNLNVIKLNFNEEIKGTMAVQVTQIRSQFSETLHNTVTVSGNSVIITLNSVPANGSYLKIDILDNKITDISGNQSVAMPSPQGVVVSYN